MSTLTDTLYLSATCHGGINLRYYIDHTNDQFQTPMYSPDTFVLSDSLTNFIKLNAATINYCTTYDYEIIEGEKIGVSIENIHAYLRHRLQEPNVDLRSIIDFFKSQGTDFYQMDLVIDGSLFSQNYVLNENKLLLNKVFSNSSRSDHSSGEDYGIYVLNDPLGQSRNLLDLVSQSYGMGMGNKISITMEQIVESIIYNFEYRQIVFFDNSCNSIMINDKLDIGDIVTTTDSYKKKFGSKIRCLDTDGNRDVTRYYYNAKISKKYAEPNSIPKIVGIIMGKSTNDGYYIIKSANVEVDDENNITQLQILDKTSEYYVTEITSIKLPLNTKRDIITTYENGYGTSYQSFGGKNIKRNKQRKQKKIKTKKTKKTKKTIRKTKGKTQKVKHKR